MRKLLPIPRKRLVGVLGALVVTLTLLNAAQAYRLYHLSSVETMATEPHMLIQLDTKPCDGYTINVQFADRHMHPVAVLACHATPVPKSAPPIPALFIETDDVLLAQ